MLWIIKLTKEGRWDMELFNQQQSISRLKERVIQEVEQAFPYENKGYRVEVKNVTVELCS